MDDTGCLTEVEMSNIFRDYRRLTPDYIPPRLVARDEQIAAVRKILKPIIRYRGKPYNAILYGGTGLGKTATIKFVLQELKEAILKNKLTNYVPIYVNCNNNPISQILYTIILELDPDCDFPSTGYAIKRYYDKIFELMNEKEVSIILTLDEIDLLKEDMLLYMFSRAGVDRIKPNLHIGIIGVTNQIQWGDQLDNRITATWNVRKIVFPKYDSFQITQILDERKDAFAEGILDEEVTLHIAAIAAQESGDARRAIELFRLCGEYADENDLDRITPEIIPLVSSQMDTDQVAAVISSLQIHAKEALAGVVKAIDQNDGKEVQTGEAMNIYHKFCALRGLRPVSRTRFSNIISELDTLGIINANYKNSRGRGKTRGISLCVDPATIIGCLIHGADGVDYELAEEPDGSSSSEPAHRR